MSPAYCELFLFMPWYFLKVNWNPHLTWHLISIISSFAFVAIMSFVNQTIAAGIDNS